MCEVELEPADVFVDTYQVARKEHRCSCCSGPIVVGERYLKHFQVFEGTPLTEKACAACAADRETFTKDPNHGSSCPSYFREMLNDCVDHTDANDRWRPMLDALTARRRAALAARGGGR